MFQLPTNNLMISGGYNINYKNQIESQQLSAFRTKAACPKPLTQLCGHKTENYVLSISWYELALRSGTTSFILSGCQCSFDYFPGMTLHPQ